MLTIDFAELNALNTVEAKTGIYPLTSGLVGRRFPTEPIDHHDEGLFPFKINHIGYRNDRVLKY